MNTNNSVNRSHWLIFCLLVSGLIVFSVLDLFLGSVVIPVKDIIQIIFTKNSDKQEWICIVFDFRIPKTLTAILSGAALSVSGLQMQTVFRNPLAGPYVLGISSGASLGVAIIILCFSSAFSFQYFGILGDWAIVLAAWAGAGLILLLIIAVSVRVRDIMTILILGILFGAATASVLSILQYFSNESVLKAFIIWTMGSLGSVTGNQMLVLTVCVLAGLALSVFSSKILNALLLGENYAKTMGLNIKLSRLFIFISTSILAGTVTAFCGPIGFIGIAVPHITRFIFRTANHNFLIPGTILTGAIIMLISDIISQLPGQDINLPINSVTALLGIPIIIWIIIRNYRVSSFS